MIKNNKLYRGRRSKAFFLSFLFFTYTLLGYVPHSFAAPDSTYVSEINEYFLNNPRWEPAEYMAEIQDIQNKTLEPIQNGDNEWLNPHVYKYYNKTVVYGKPHGLFFNNSNSGHMQNKDTKMQGEYQYLGHNKNGKSVTNDFYHHPSWSGIGKFTTYKEVSYKTIDGASNSWGTVNNDLFEYLMDSYFWDDDYVTPGQTPYNLRYILNEVFGGDINRFKKCVLIQIPPGVGSAASFRMEYGVSHWNTCTIKDAFFEYNFTGNLTTDKTTYTLKAGENDIVVTAALMAKLSGTSNNKYLRDVTFEFLNEENSTDISLTQDTYKKENIKITYNRSELQTGSKDYSISAFITVNSLYGDTKTIPVEANFTIVVEENPDPWVTAIMTATPKTREFIGGNIPVKLDIAYGIANIKNANLINDIVLTIPGEGSFTKTPMLVGEHTLNAIIPASYMTGYDTRNKTYSCNVKYNMKDGNSYAYDTSAVVHIVSNVPMPGASPTPTPTPIPINQNSPPYVILDAPASVKAGERFKVTAKGNDDDGDPLTYYWDVNYATIAINSTTQKYLRYDKLFANSVQEVYCEVSDGKDIGGDVVAINVMEPSIDALMNITGTLKENRKITLNDVSQSPEYYPITNRQWTITPISGIVSTEIKTDGNLTGVSEDITIKGSGIVRVSLWVKNSAGYEKTISRTLSIAEDLPPVADLSTVTVNFRDPDHSDISTFEITNKCYSPDNDKISRIILRYRYDTNNNGSFTDESFVTVYDGISKNKILVDVTQVGKYEFYIEAQEEFGQTYISSYVTSADKLKSNKSVTVEVANIAPIISYSLKEKESIDLIFDIGKTTYSTNLIESKINEYIKPALMEKGYNVNINIKSMDKSETMHNLFVYHTSDSNNTYKIKIYDPITNLVETIKTITYPSDSDVYLRTTFVDGKGDIYYETNYNGDGDYETNLYKIDLLTHNTTCVKDISSSYYSYTYKLGQNNVFYSRKSGEGPLAIRKDGAQFSSSNTNKVLMKKGSVNRNYQFPYSDDKVRSIFIGPENYIYAYSSNFNNDMEYIGYFDSTNEKNLYVIIVYSSDYYPCSIEGVDKNGYAYISTGYGYHKRFKPGEELKTVPKPGGGDAGWLEGFGLDGTIYYSLATQNGFGHWSNNSVYLETLDNNLKSISNSELEYDITDSWYFKSSDISHNTIEAYDMGKSYNNLSLNSKNKSFYIPLHDDLFSKLFNDYYYKNATDKMIMDNVNVITLGNNNNKIQCEKVINFNNKNGIYIDNTNIDSAFLSMKNYILNNIGQKDEVHITKYVEVDQNLEITSYYEDYENDPQYSVRYKYNHDPNYFENGLGYANNMGVYVTTPMLCFSKPGLYEMDIQAQDNPKNNAAFDNYRLWSYPRKMTLYVHRPPVPVFTVKAIKSGMVYNVSYAENSYDLDHLSRADKGIVNKRWFYKENSSPTWVEGKLPSSIAANKTYQVKLDVMDREFSWASSVQVVSTVPVNHNPIAQFYFKNNPVSKYDYTTISNVIVDTSTDPDGDTITERKWTVKKGGVVQPNGVNTVLNTAVEGEYIVSLEVKDSKNAWSAPYTQTLTVVGDITPPTLSLTPLTRPWANTNVAVTMNCADTGGSGLKEVRYLWTKNPDFADGEFTTVATTGNISRTQTADGNWYLYAQTVDNAGNASPIVKGGDYQIDKAAPTLSDYKVTGEDYRSGNTFWIAKNKSVDVYIKALEQLSGMRYTYLRVPLGGDNRAYHDFSGAFNYLNEFDTSTYTDIIAAERTINDIAKGEYEVRFTLKGLNDLVSDLQYYFSDKVGNVVGYNNSGYKIGVDTLPPTITITPGQRDLGKTEITASVSVADAGSGVKQSKYIVSNSAIKPAAGAGWTSVFNSNFNVNITGTGTWYLYLESVDNVGNVSSTRAGAFKVDLDGPVITANPINRVWDNSNVLISLTAAEAYSSLKEVRYSVTNNTGRVYGGWQHVNSNQNNTVELKENGTWYLHVEAEDVAGNITYTYFGPYRVDKEAPALTMGYVGGARYILGNNYYARKGDTVTFWMQGMDAHSGMWRLFALARDGVTDPFRGALYNNTFPIYNTHTRVAVNTPTIIINNGKSLRANFPYQILSTGDYTYRIEGIADDLATYNRHGWVDKGYRLITDNTAPLLAVDNSGGQCIGMASIKITSTDTGSGVKNVSYVWANSLTPPTNGWVTVSSSAVTASMSNEGTWYLHINSADNVDNISTTKSYGPYEVIHINASDFKVTQIYDMSWRGYYFNLHAGIDTNGDGEPDQFPKRANTDIMTTSMPINKNHLISYSADGIKAGYKFEGSVTVLGEPDSVSFRINYKANNTQKFDIVTCTKAVIDSYNFEWIVPLETDADTYLEFDLIVVKGTDTYSNEVWADTWASSNTSRRVMYVVEGSATDDLTFIQSK